MSARDLVEGRARWVIGNGRTTRFWNNEWDLGTLCGRLVSPPLSSKKAGSLVEEWRSENGCEWDMQVLTTHQTEAETKAINSTYVALRDQEDFLSWPLTKKGEFTFRSAHHYEL